MKHYPLRAQSAVIQQGYICGIYRTEGIYRCINFVIEEGLYYGTLYG